MSKPKSNFRLLDPDAPRTGRLIEAILDARDPLPWSGPPTAQERPPLAKLAQRIHERARAGKNVTLKPETALKVSEALTLIANGPIGTWELEKNYGFRLLSYGPSDTAEVLAYCRNVHIGKGAFDGAAASMPGARLALRWGGFSPKKNFK
jgi:hypothetical protein